MKLKLKDNTIWMWYAVSLLAVVPGVISGQEPVCSQVVSGEQTIVRISGLGGSATVCPMIYGQMLDDVTIVSWAFSQLATELEKFKREVQN